MFGPWAWFEVKAWALNSTHFYLVPGLASSVGKSWVRTISVHQTSESKRKGLVRELVGVCLWSHHAIGNKAEHRSPVSHRSLMSLHVAKTVELGAGRPSLSEYSANPKKNIVPGETPSLPCVLWIRLITTWTLAAMTATAEYILLHAQLSKGMFPNFWLMMPYYLLSSDLPDFWTYLFPQTTGPGAIPPPSPSLCDIRICSCNITRTSLGLLLAKCLYVTVRMQPQQPWFSFILNCFNLKCLHLLLYTFVYCLLWFCKLGKEHNKVTTYDPIQATAQR